MPERRTAERNRLATFPLTASARQNHSLLIKRSQLVRYDTIARATGHDKSWVSRFLSGSALASLPELLAWLDECDLRIATQEIAEHALGPSHRDWAPRLQQAFVELGLTANTPLGDTQADSQVLLALIELARIGLDALLETNAPPGDTENANPPAPAPEE